jgi:hypothetical protein
MSWSDMTDSIRRCDLLLDIGGMCWLEERHLARRRVLVDCDPLFTQVQGFAFEILHEYDVHFSYGSNLGEPGCTVPTGGVDWLPVAPPVVPDLWSSPPVTPGSPLRTVANWTAYGGVSHDGTLYGQKESEFARVIELPGRTTTPLELALSSADDVVRALFRDAGWGVRDGFAVTRTLDDYRAYIAGSAGEFSVAKHAYVATRSGWFSERSACFLAAGRPVVVQETGFSDWLPTGQGVIGFRTVDEAAAAIAAVAADPDEHAAAALDLVARYFDYRVVLPDLLDRSLHSSVVGMTRR